MIIVLGTCVAVLLIAVLVLLWKIKLLHQSAEELRHAFSSERQEDSNVGITISGGDRTMRKLAAELDQALHLLRQQQIRYLQGDHELKQAVTNMSHDLRTPLTAICGYLELLEQESVSDPVRQYLSVIENRVEVLKTLTEELFRYSVILSVDHYQSRTSVSLNQALEESIAAFYGALTERGIQPQVEIPETAVVRTLHADALGRILSNVLSNAIKYSTGDLCISLSASGQMRFENHTAQLDDVSVAQLFDRFYTVANGQQSTGLGLSIAKALTEQMGGCIEAAIQNGCFCLTLTF